MYADTPRRSHRRRPDLNIDTSPSAASHSRPSFASSREPPDTAATVVPQTPPPPSKRNKPPPISLPRAKSSSRALRGPSLSRHADDSLLDAPESPDSFIMVSNKENNNPNNRQYLRDSHDLSLSPRNVTRDSLMTNMLISLDQFSLGGAVGDQAAGPGANIFGEPSQQYPYEADGDSLPRQVRGRRSNGHSYSYSSDFDYDPDDASRISSRMRRSISSSNFQAGLRRMSSMRESLRSTPGTPRHHIHRRGGRGSRGSVQSSSSNSFDAGYAQVLGSTRWASGFGGRSSSFDYGHRPPPPVMPPVLSTAMTATHQQGQAPWHIEFSNNFFSGDDYDAAPTPTVPGGPRRMPSLTPIAAPAPAPALAPALAPAPVPAPASAPALPIPAGEMNSMPAMPERKRSNRSTRSTSANRKVENKANNPHEEVPPVPVPVPATDPTFEINSAPAPHVGYGKTEKAVHGAPIPIQTPSQTKEKPGFFRRVFGSSRNNASSSHTPETPGSSAVSSSTTTDTVDQRSGNRSQHTASQMKSSTSNSTPPSRDTSSSHSHHVLQKKPSSFFRRRKKSVSTAEEAPPVQIAATLEPVPPLMPTIQFPASKDKSSAKPEPSPISSLRRVMNPYLKGSPATTPNTPTPNTPLTPQSASSVRVAEPEMAPDQASSSAPGNEGAAEAEEHPRSFSPDYDPSPNARIRKVRSGSRDEDDYHPEHERRTDTPTRPPPEPPSSMEEKNNSFLDIDGSDNEMDSETKSDNKASKQTAGKLSKDPVPIRRGQSDRKGDTIRVGKKHIRLAADPDSEDDGKKLGLIIPNEGTRSASRASGSTTTDYKSAVSRTPSVKVENSENSPRVVGTFDSMSAKPLDEPEFVVGDPTDDDRQKAQKIFDGNEDFIQKEKAAAWMGEEGPVRQRTLRAYMDLYDFQNKSILQSLRLICERLVFRAETQQVDRILVAFSKRWCECNTNHGFKASDVIHTICYSIMLLNTDLHLADIDQKMTRSQFVKNTMTTIVQAVGESAPDAFERPSILPGKVNSPINGSDEGRASVEERFGSRRLSFRPPPLSRNDDGTEHANDGCGPLVKAPFDGPMRAWETQVEVVLKDIYTSIRDERLPLFGADPSKNLSPNPANNLSVIGMLKRTPSVLSKAPSESQASMRGRIAENGRANSSRWNSKSRSRPRMGNPGFSSSRTSFEDGNSVWSPTGSSATWSRISLGRTQTSMSVDSFSSSFRGGDYQQSIGFANALSQAIIRDDESGPGGKAPSIISDDLKSAQLLEDESLELAGPPWVKEGIVIHKHHLDGIDKRAKDRHWNEVFAVIQKGQMSIFSFGGNKSMGRKSRGRHAAKGPAIVGGGNWQENATNLGTFSLRQTLASALPPPGYSRARPNVWALSLPTGAVHLFQVGTPEICKEFVTTANYWSARLSTHPLVGGISNIEYGWSDAIINNALVTAINESTTSQPAGRISRPGSSAATHRQSIQSITRRSASFDHGAGGPYNGVNRGNKLPGDRIHISDWTPPTQSMRPSNLPEEEQLQGLLAYVQGIEDELQTHNQLRSPMLLAFTPRGSNAVRAMANWERKSAYLLREIVKFRTYVDCLQQAATRKNEIYSERELARRAARGELDEDEIEFDVPQDTTIRT